MRSAPVWVWQPGTTDPVQAGTLSHDEASGAGRFQYDAAYVRNGGQALDADQLRHLDARAVVNIKASDREGVPAIVADAGPDTWGRRVLAQDHGYEPDAFDSLVLSADDGVGNLAVGTLAEKPETGHLDLAELADAIENRFTGSVGGRTLSDRLVSPDTALGGAKPKATTLIHGSPYIAKFPEKGDPIDLPYYEAVALRIASHLGIDSANADVHSLPAGRSVLLVRRFDRTMEGGRLAFASALTVMGPGAQVAMSPTRSYLWFARSMRRWTRETAPYPSSQRLWDRIVFNALVGNGDDHPRNHGLLFREGRWGLAPMFDVVPTYIPRERLSLAMPFLAQGRNGQQRTSFVSAANLILAAPEFGIDPEAARDRILAMADAMATHWAQVLAELQTPPAVAYAMENVLTWVARLRNDAREFAPVPPASKPRVSRSWNWHP